MKKAFFASLFVFFFIYTLDAQTPKTSWGIKGGFNHTTINGVESDGDKTGFIGSSVYGALFLEHSLGNSTYLNIEALFSWVNDWHYIEIPIHIRQMLTKNGSLFAGPKLDFTADKLDPQKQSQSGRFGISIELGGQYTINRLLFAEARYGYGITKQFKDPGFDINEGRRDNWRVGIGMRL